MHDNAPTEIGVAILSFNRPEFLREAVISVLRQTQKPAFIRVYDNGSKPAVRQSIEDLLDSVEWVGSDLAYGVIWNFERAVRACDSHYVVLLHDDDRLCPEFLQVQSQLLLKNPDVHVLSCNGHIIDEAGSRSGMLLLPQEGTGDIRCSDSIDVSLVYVGSRCVPFSPAIYKTQSLKRVPLRPEYSKVMDAVLFCDLANGGAVVVNMAPLYECRVHPQQDSHSFDPAARRRLDAFFWDRSASSEARRRLLRREIAANGARRVVGDMLSAARDGRIIAMIIIPFRGWSGMYSIFSGMQYLCSRVLRSIYNK